MSHKDTTGAQSTSKQRPSDNSPTIMGGNFKRDCAKAIDNLATAFRELKKDIDNWYKLYNSGKKTEQDRGHGNELVNRCLHAIRARAKALRECSDYELGSNKDWQTLLNETFHYLNKYCTPNPKANPALRGVSEKDLKRLKDEWKTNPVQFYEPRLVDMTSLMVPAVAGARCGAGILSGAVEWLRDLLRNIFRKPIPQQPRAKPTVPDKKAT